MTIVYKIVMGVAPSSAGASAEKSACMPYWMKADYKRPATTADTTASRVNTTVMMRAMRGRVSEELERYADRLKEHGAKEDLVESRRAFAEKRAPRFKGWNNPEDRDRTPKLDHK